MKRIIAAFVMLLLCSVANGKGPRAEPLKDFSPSSDDWVRLLADVSHEREALRSLVGSNDLAAKDRVKADNDLLKEVYGKQLSSLVKVLRVVNGGVVLRGPTQPVTIAIGKRKNEIPPEVAAKLAKDDELEVTLKVVSIGLQIVPAVVRVIEKHEFSDITWKIPDKGADRRNEQPPIKPAAAAGSAVPVPAHATEFDSKPVLTVGQVMEKVAKLLAPYGDKPTALQINTLRDDLSSWASGKVVEIPVIIRDVSTTTTGLTVQIGLPRSVEEAQMKRRAHGPSPSAESPEIFIAQSNFPMSMPKDEALALKAGQAVNAYFSVLAGTGTFGVSVGAGLRFGDRDESLKLKFLNVKK